jgi:5-methylcytosine-specific restriction endonuclease McrA
MGDPRSTYQYRRNAALVLAATDRCHLCGHHGAHTIDHIISVSTWPPGMPGVNDLANLAPSHGTLRHGRLNRCPTCKRLCNQSRGNRTPVQQPRSRDW